MYSINFFEKKLKDNKTINSSQTLNIFLECRKERKCIIFILETKVIHKSIFEGVFLYYFVLILFFLSSFRLIFFFVSLRHDVKNVSKSMFHSFLTL